MRRALLVVTLALTACGEDGPTGTIEFHVTHYDYAFDIESRAAHAKLTIAVDTGGDCLTLPIRAIDGFASPTINGEAVSATLDGTVGTFCGSGYDTGQSITLETDMTFALATLEDSQVGYSITKDAQQNPFYYLVSWVGGCDRFGPCDNRPDQFATYRFTVTHRRRSRRAARARSPRSARPRPCARSTWTVDRRTRRSASPRIRRGP